MDFGENKKNATNDDNLEWGNRLENPPINIKNIFILIVLFAIFMSFLFFCYANSNSIKSQVVSKIINLRGGTSLSKPPLKALPAPTPVVQLKSIVAPTPPAVQKPANVLYYKKSTPSPDAFTPQISNDFMDELSNNWNKDGVLRAYLTFDDGPSGEMTNKILDVLKSNNIKATFFVIGSNAKEFPSNITRIYNEGHVIGNHTYSHIYKNIYSSPDAFMNEIRKTQNVLKNILGENFNTRLVRFPGGSHEAAYLEYKNLLIKEGYGYVDWNVVSGDGEGADVSANKLIDNVIESSNGKKDLIILMHDAAEKTTTLETLQRIIDYIRGKGYLFNTLPY